MSNVQWVFVGLGNPGAKYEGTRHNIGFDVVDAFAKRLGTSITSKDGEALVGEAKVSATSGKVLLVKPQSFMNRSGEPVQKILNFYKVRTTQLFVIYDDCELDVGRMKLQSGGAHGGHNGIRSLETMLGTKDFMRCRVGISRPPPATMELADWVLGRYGAEDAAKVSAVIDKCVDACIAVVESGFVRAQNAANKN